MVSTKGRYALRIMIDLAQHRGEGYISLKEISLRQEVSIKYMESIVSALSRAGLVNSRRGKEGGYILTLEPADCDVFMIMKAAEGELSPVACDALCGSGCLRSAECYTLPVWTKLDEMIEEYLSGISLQDLIDRKY